MERRLPKSALADKLLISLEIPQVDGYAMLRYTTPEGVAARDVIPLFERAIKALEAEIAAFEDCPMHRVDINGR